MTPEDDLRWHFGGAAECALGLRSALGGQLALLADGVSNCSRSGNPDDSITHYIMESAERDRAIVARLRMLDEHHHRALELQYSSTAMYGNVSLALAAESPTAQLTFREIANMAKRVGKLSKSRRKSVASVATWLLWLASTSTSNPSTGKTALLAMIMAEARAALAAATFAYITADVGTYARHV